MATRNSDTIKKVIYNTLKNDAPLVALIGGASKIRYEKPTKNVTSYPCIVYNFLEEGDQPYEEVFATGIARTLVEIQIFDRVENSSKTLDAVADRIYAILHGQKIDGGLPNVTTFSLYRTSKTRMYENEPGIRRIITNYSFVNYSS